VPGSRVGAVSFRYVAPQLWRRRLAGPSAGDYSGMGAGGDCREPVQKGGSVGMSDFFDDDQGHARNYMATPRRAWWRDVAYDVRAPLDPRNRLIDRLARTLPRQRILVVGVEVPSRGGALQRIAAELAQSRHEVVTSLVPMRTKGKFENIDDAIDAAGQPVASFDWLIITDDDVGLPRNFTDRYIAAATLADLTVSQPAHRFLSHASYQITRRRFGAVARRTGFVEIGPLTVIRRNAFADLLPFPPSRSGFGIDVLWGEIARRNGWKMGIVDALAIRHLRPIGGGYDVAAACREGRALLDRLAVDIPRHELLRDHGELITRSTRLPAG